MAPNQDTPNGPAGHEVGYPADVVARDTTIATDVGSDVEEASSLAGMDTEEMIGIGSVLVIIAVASAIVYNLYLRKKQIPDEGLEPLKGYGN
eukprot:337501_1